MKYWIASILGHLLIISFVWVGFQVPTGKKQNTFTYLGGSVFQKESSAELNSSDDVSEIVVAGESSPAFFAPWIKMRELNKPK